MTKLSKIFFHFGNILFLFLGLAHLAGHLSGTPTPVNENQQKFLELFTTVKFEMPSGEMRTYEQIHNAFSLYFAVFPIGMSVLLWISSKHQNTLKPSLLVSIITMLATAIITYKYAILPPMIMMLMISICFLVTFLLLTRGKGKAN